jgi:hypothetical protein
MAPFSAIWRLALVCVDLVAFYFKAMVSFGILQISLIHEESNKLTFLDPSYDCYFPSSFVFLPRLMGLGSFRKLVF